MAALPFNNPRFFARDPDDDTPLVGGLVYTYMAGTTTPKLTWADYAQTSARTNPAVLEADGGIDVFGSGAYKIIVRRPDGTLVHEIDNVVIGNGDGAGNAINKGEVIYTTDHAITSADDGLTLIANRPTDITFTLDSAISLGPNFAVIVKNIGLGPLTLDPSLTDLIDGQGTRVIKSGGSALVTCNGTGFRTIFYYNDLIETAVEAAQVSALQNLPGQLYGLTLSNNVADAVNDIDIAVGRALNDANTAQMILAAGITKRLDALWVVGSGNGGLDAGAIANTTYHVFLIQRSDTGVIDALFSTSPTAPTMPTGYDRKRRIGSIIRAAGAILLFSQVGDEFLLLAPPQDVNISTLTTTAQLLTLSTPLGIKTTALLTGFMTAPGAGASIFLNAVDQTAQPSAPGRSTAINPVAAVGSSFAAELRTSTSSQIRAISDSANTTLSIVTRGWIDTRGRLAP